LSSANRPKKPCVKAGNVLRQERLAVVGQLAAGIAHEFNNILTVVQGHTCLLMASEELSKEGKEPLERISVGIRTRREPDTATAHIQPQTDDADTVARFE